MTGEAPRHGGDLALASLRHGVPRDGWLDLSTGINPRPYPLPAVPGAIWSRLPQSDQSLRASSSRTICARVALIGLRRNRCSKVRLEDPGKNG